MSRRREIKWVGELPHQGEQVGWNPNYVHEEGDPERWRSWWPADSVESDRWAEETQAVVAKVWRIHGRRFYFGARNTYVQEELHDALTVQALEFREKYRPPENGDDPLDTWARILFTSLKWYVMDFVKEVNENRRGNHSSLSLDQLTGWADPDADTTRAERATLHGQPLEQVDPERYWITIESITERHDPRGPDGYKDTHHCIESGCPELARKLGMCNTHYGRHRELHATAPCAATGCTSTTFSKGLCRRHYDEQRKSSTDRPRCTENGCDSPVKGRGLCQRHLDQRRASGLPLPPSQRKQKSAA